MLSVVVNLFIPSLSVWNNLSNIDNYDIISDKDYETHN